MAVLYAGSKKDVADTIGIAERTFSSWLSEGCPGDTRKREYSMLEIIQWAKENKWTDDEQKLIDSIDDEDLKAQFLKEKVEKTRLENRLLLNKAEMQDSSLVDRVIMEEMLSEYSKRLRSSLETLQKKYGRDAFLLVASVIDKMQCDIANGGAFDISSGS